MSRKRHRNKGDFVQGAGHRPVQPSGAPPISHSNGDITPLDLLHDAPRENPPVDHSRDTRTFLVTADGVTTLDEDAQANHLDPTAHHPPTARVALHNTDGYRNPAAESTPPPDSPPTGATTLVEPHVDSALATHRANGAGYHDGTGHHHGNGGGSIPEKARVVFGSAESVTGVRPVKVRIGEKTLGNGHTNGHSHAGNTLRRYNGNGHENGNGHTNGNGNGHSGAVKARLGSDVVVIAKPKGTTTTRLRESDLLAARVRLNGPGVLSAAGTRDLGTLPVPAPWTRRSAHKRPLPYFMMRHRNMRIHSRVGYTRAQASVRRLGKRGAGAATARILMALTLLAMLLTAGGIGGGFGGAYWYLHQLPPVDPAHLPAAIAQNAISVQTTRLYDRNGVPLYDFEDEQTGRREELRLDQISPLVISATIATEDASFYTNWGVDPYGIGRAIYINFSGKGESGASTITQQVARLVLLSPEERAKRTGLDGLSRKIEEAVLAVQLTRTYSKNQIMELYLNQIPYGHRAYGIGAAARTYFNKSAKDVTLAEAALLAGLPQAPSTYDPLINPEAAKARQAIVLDLMAKQGMITQQQAEDAKNQQIFLRPYQPPFLAPHFVYYIKQYLEDRYGPDFADAGLKVYTTLDIRVQNAAQEVAKERVAEIRQQNASNAAIVILKPGTGEILAMVGSVDYSDTSIDGQVNMATSPRQPGSSFKPITYSTAFTKGWSPATVILDVSTRFPGGPQPYVPHNYDGRDHGYVTVRDALAQSLNVPAVKAIQFAGLQDTIDMAHAMGIKGLNRDLSWYGLSLTLGGGEVSLLDMVNAYATLANYGQEVDANPILSIEDPQGRIVYCNSAYNCQRGGHVTDVKSMADSHRVLDPRIAYQVTSILTDNRARTPEFGANSPLRMDFPAAAKTGTTDNNRDSWTLGYTPALVIGVWVGNTDNAEMQSVTGAIGAAVIWHNMMQTFYNNSDFVNLLRPQNPDGTLQPLTTDFYEPDGLVRRTVCSARGAITDIFLSDQVPRGCTTYKDPPGNVLLHGAPSNRPVTRPTPRPSQRTGGTQQQQQQQQSGNQQQQPSQPQNPFVPGITIAKPTPGSP